MMLSPGKQLELEGHELASKVIELEEKAHEVRRLQKQYFKTRSPEVLNHSKQAEKELDTLLHSFNYDDQQVLF